jgi:hypothetical protein
MYLPVFSTARYMFQQLIMYKTISLLSMHGDQPGLVTHALRTARPTTVFSPSSCCYNSSWHLLTYNRTTDGPGGGKKIKDYYLVTPTHFHSWTDLCWPCHVSRCCSRRQMSLVSTTCTVELSLTSPISGRRARFFPNQKLSKKNRRTKKLSWTHNIPSVPSTEELTGL